MSIHFRKIRISKSGIRNFLLLILLFVPLSYIWYRRVGTFGCFDDCNNFMGGYFLLHGKKLFSEIFFNHMPGMAYLSVFIQFTLHPKNLYQLVMFHRIFVIGLSFIFDLFLLIRFEKKVWLFIVFFELTKYYLFGNRFLAEGVIIYPLLYIFGLCFEQYRDKTISAIDIALSAIFTWFVVFMREPYIPLALFLYGWVLFSLKNKRVRINSTVLFGILTLVTLLFHNIPELIFNVYTVNKLNISGEQTNLLISFFYPVYLLFKTQWSIFGTVLFGLNVVFLGMIGWLLKTKKLNFKFIIFVFLTLGLANLRIVEPGKVFYDSFHMLIWYGLFLFTLSCLLGQLSLKAQKIAVGLVVIVLLFFLGSRQNYLYEKVNPAVEFTSNYGITINAGEAVKALSQPSDTLFLDGFDDTVYWVSGRYSDYQYSWYTSLMYHFPKYTEARLSMFRSSPPDFYYGTCRKGGPQEEELSNSIKKDYVELKNLGKPSCVWVNKKKVSGISKNQWSSVSQFGYSL